MLDRLNLFPSFISMTDKYSWDYKDWNLISVENGVAVYKTEDGDEKWIGLYGLGVYIWNKRIKVIEW